MSGADAEADPGAGLEPCPGCGEPLSPIDGAIHAYVGASSACWTRFAEINASLPSGGTPLRRLVTDAYMVQHPGASERRAIQSVGLHLVALYLVLDRGLPPADLSATLRRVLARPPLWHWLAPPVPNGTLTIGDVGAAASGGNGAVAAVIDAYVSGAWAAWRAYHGVVAGWARDAGFG